jgi:hypothetical protein
MDGKRPAESPLHLARVIGRHLVNNGIGPMSAPNINK